MIGSSWQRPGWASNSSASLPSLSTNYVYRVSVGMKIGWTVFSVLCGIVALTVWLIWGRKRANRDAQSA
jgi:hypothetical protein